MLVILGLGNDLLGDDAVGLLAAEKLEGRFGGDVVVRRSAQSGLYLLEALQDCEDAILIDSVLGERRGRVRELDAEAVKPVPVPSAHYAGLPEVLAVARSAGLSVPRRIRILAVEIGDTQTIGAGPGTEVLAGIPEVLERAVAIARSWGYEERRQREEDSCTSTA